MQPFVSALGTELGLTSKEIADIIWLALQMQNSDETVETATSLEPSTAAETTDDRSRPSLEDFTSPSDRNEQPDRTSQAKSAEVHLNQPNANQASFGQQLALNVPDARSLREPLSLARSLKPLLRRVVTGWSTVLDEAATVDRIAAEQLWLPVLKPALEPWLDLALVVDESASMQLWQRTIAELQRLLSHYGVFRDVRVWGMVTDVQGQVQLRPGIGAAAQRQAARRPSELLDPSGRRLILVATDCVSSDWQDGSLLAALKLWATSGPLAIVQMLPEWLWSRTGLGFASAVRLQSLLPGVPNQQLIAKDLSPWDEVDLEAGLKVPVVTLEPEPFAAWTEMVMGKGGAWSPGFVFEPEIVTSNGQVAQLSEVATEDSAEQRVQQFRVTASPMARRLAGLLAAAPVISLPVVRIIQDRLLAGARQVHVAEVFLGGLLKPVGEVQAEANPDAVQYDFWDGVREALLESVPTGDSVNVLEEVSKFVAERLGLSLDAFTAVLRNPQQTENRELASQSRPFAMVTAQILRQLGGEYVQFAEDLEGANQVNSQSKVLNLPPIIQQRLLDDIFNALEPYKPLEASDPAYVDCDVVRGDGDILDNLGNRIRKSRQTTYQLYSGYRGAGKSTELLRLKGNLETEGCFVVYFSAIEEDVNSGDIEYTDILLACTSHLLTELKKTANTKPLQDWLKERWEDLKDLAQTKVTLEGLDAEVAVNQFAKLTANLRTEPTLRSRIREKINPHTHTLIKALNEFIQDAKTKLPEGKTKLVLIVDNLDRIAPIYDERSGRSNHEEIFISHSKQLKALDCHIIYTIPFVSLFSKWANDLNQNYNDSKILPMIMVRSPDGAIHAPGVATIKQILAQRIQPFAADLDLETEIFESAATLGRLCLMSGGHMRGLLSLAQEAVNRTDTLPISAKALQRAITEKRDSYRRSVEEHQWHLLAAVSRTKQIHHDMAHRSLLFNLCLLEYSYLDEQGEKLIWYDVHPMLHDLPKFKEALSTILPD